MKLSRHPYFTEWTDSVSHVKSYVLTQAAAPQRCTPQPKVLFYPPKENFV